MKWTHVCVKHNAWHLLRSKILILQIFIECQFHTGTVLGSGDLTFSMAVTCYIFLQLFLFSPSTVTTNQIASFSNSPACPPRMWVFSFIICTASSCLHSFLLPPPHLSASFQYQLRKQLPIHSYSLGASWGPERLIYQHSDLPKH